MVDATNSGFTTRTAIACIAAAIILAGCTKADLPPPIKTELPNKPAAAKEECEPLNEHEDHACLQEGPEARKVCRKVERNDVICKGNQQFITRLYKERQGK